MDISSTTPQVSTPAETSASNQTPKTSSKGDTSFKEEMGKVSDNTETKADNSVDTKTDAKTELNTESKSEFKTESKANLIETSKQEFKLAEVNFKNTDIATIIGQADNKNTDIIQASAEQNQERTPDLAQTALLSGEINFQNPAIQEVQNIQDVQDFALQNIQTPDIQAQVLIDANVMLSEVVSVAKTPVKVDYTTVKMDMNDTQFFMELVQDTDKTIQNVVTEITQNAEADVQEIQKNVKVSATLMNALSEAVKNKQSFRIDFDKDVSVIIKVDRDGAITARFIPGDSAVEQYLKQNISALRQRFDDQELAYNELSYTGQQRRNKKNNNKENGHE